MYGVYMYVLCIISIAVLPVQPIRLIPDPHRIKHGFFPWDAQVHHHVQPWVDAPVISVSGVCIIMMSKNTSGGITSGHVPVQPTSTHARTHMKVP